LIGRRNIATVYVNILTLLLTKLSVNRRVYLGKYTPYSGTFDIITADHNEIYISCYVLIFVL